MTSPNMVGSSPRGTLRDLRTPFGGVKSSGLGREGGRHSIDVYTEPHVIHMATDPLPT
ncbi:aldehyde dehydrogenase family protein [Nonomuraea sp. NPDC050536]|uniref:aldehyde dehydrogenase family protein n=1 Tax=Nonomuraea sp. NPDC050536 TaxID=3364366 RepID=UPI0037CBA7B1